VPSSRFTCNIDKHAASATRILVRNPAARP
jgi:hypothetical protein